MFAQQQLFPPYGPRARLITVRQGPPVDRTWTHAWPTVGSALIGALMLISSAAVVGLDIGNLAIEGNKPAEWKAFGQGPAKVGAGLWSGSISFLAAVFILTIACVRNKRIAATFALIAVGLAFLFTIVLVGLTANALQLNANLYTQQHRLVIAILSIALFILTQCLAYMFIYAGVFVSFAARVASAHTH